MSDQLTILHVDDDADIREISRMSLEIVGGFNVVQFKDGATAVEGAHNVEPDLILLDVMMPGMDGMETLRGLRRVPGYAEKPIAFMTAKASHEDNEQLLELGAVAVITKPFDPLKLPDQLKDILAAYDK